MDSNDGQVKVLQLCGGGQGEQPSAICTAPRCAAGPAASADERCWGASPPFVIKKKKKKKKNDDHTNVHS